MPLRPTNLCTRGEEMESEQELNSPKGENQAAASGSGAPAVTGGHPLAALRSGACDVQIAAAWLASSLPLRATEGLQEWREVYRTIMTRRATISSEWRRGAGVVQEEILVNGQSPCVALYYATTGAVVQAVARIDPSLLKGPAGVTALVRAAGANLTDVVRELLAAGVDPNDWNARFSSGGTPAHTAALKGNTMCLLLLKEYGADVNARLPHGGTPLHIATLHGRTEYVDVLLALGADVNAVCTRMLTPLHVAVLAGYVECVAVLMTGGANSKLRDDRGHEPLCYAVEKEDIVIARRIVKLQGYYTSWNTLVRQDGYPTCGHSMVRIYEACSSGD